MTTQAIRVTRAKRRPGTPRFGRGDRSALGRWFWDVDRVLLLLVAVLIGIGLVAVAAASPAAAVRYSGGAVQFNPLHYLYRQLMWLAVGVPVMLIVSMLPQETARKLSIAGAGFFILCLALVPLIGVEVNGARRWLGVGISQFQPSEFLKPLFVVTTAWLLSLRARDKSMPVFWMTGALTVVVGLLLMKQPDFGQTVIFLSIWVSLLLISGEPMRKLFVLGGLGLAGIVAAYLFYDVATDRINRFISGEGDTYQVDMAHDTIVNGGFIGTGPGSGTMKFRLPEPHTDYIFSVIGEEFGLIACLAVACLFLAIVVRVFVRLLHEEDDFLLLASAGLTIQFGLQALINMAVNVHLVPSKGMTLPFISYGGSSMIALSMGFGLLLAFTRANPYLKRSPYVVKWSGR